MPQSTQNNNRSRENSYFFLFTLKKNQTKQKTIANEDRDSNTELTEKETFIDFISIV